MTKDHKSSYPIWQLVSWFLTKLRPVIYLISTRLQVIKNYWINSNYILVSCLAILIKLIAYIVCVNKVLGSFDRQNFADLAMFLASIQMLCVFVWSMRRRLEEAPTYDVEISFILMVCANSFTNFFFFLHGQNIAAEIFAIVVYLQILSFSVFLTISTKGRFNF